MNLTGNKINLKPITESMTNPLFEAFSQMDEECRIMTGTRQEITKEKVRAYASRVEKLSNEYHFYIETVQPKRIIGELALTDIDLVNKHSNFRFSIYSPENRNQGFGFEAMKLALEFGFEKLKLHRIDLTVYEYNERAIHLYQKIGFVKEGVFRDLFYYEDKFYDGILMSMLEDEYYRSSEVGLGSA